jgi:hypothetical protein
MIYEPQDVFFCAAAFFLLFSRWPMAASAAIPVNTNPTPTHCQPLSLCPNQTTDRIMVNIFRVTVIVTRTRDSKLARVKSKTNVSGTIYLTQTEQAKTDVRDLQMKTCPIAPQAQNPRTSQPTCGYFATKAIAPSSSVPLPMPTY